MAQQTELGWTKQSINNETFINEAFSVTFTWKGKVLKVQLKNGEDVLKLAELLSNYLTENGIENTITE